MRDLISMSIDDFFALPPDERGEILDATFSVEARHYAEAREWVARRTHALAERMGWGVWDANNTRYLTPHEIHRSDTSGPYYVTRDGKPDGEGVSRPRALGYATRTDALIDDLWEWNLRLCED